MEPNTTRNSGFASMEQEKQREIARKGGKAAHRKGTAHEFTVEEARFAGRKGGQQVSANRRHMMEIGRLGGKRSAERRRQRAAAAKQPPQANMSEPDATLRQYVANADDSRQPGADEPGLQ
jgi:general stress protein YciG